MRTLFAIGIAQILQAVFIAKQANAYYMIPSFMLSPLSLVLSLRWLQGRLSATIPEFAKTALTAVLTAAVVIGSGTSVWRLDNELRELKFRAFSSQPEKFDKCIRIFIYAASSPVYALYLGDRTTGFRFTDRLRKVIPVNDFWIDDWVGPVSIGPSLHGRPRRAWTGLKKSAAVVSLSTGSTAGADICISSSPCPWNGVRHVVFDA